jgi:hypothetical protein
MKLKISQLKEIAKQAEEKTFNKACSKMNLTGEQSQLLHEQLIIHSMLLLHHIAEVLSESGIEIETDLNK